MKRCLIVLLILLGSALQAMSQDHLCFLGQPITGNMKDFVAQMESKGLTKGYSKGWFKGMRTKYLKGTFWRFPDCDIVVRGPKNMKDATSVYVHPHSNFLLLDDLVQSLDERYGAHDIRYSNADINAMNYVWSVPEGSIVIYASTTYGQVFDIVYRDHVEVKLLSISANMINDDL